MHTYASDSSDRRVVPWILGATALGMAYLYWIVSRKTGYSLPWWCETPTPMFAYGLLHYLYDSFLWRKRVFGIGLSSIPNFQGTWFGILRSSHEGETKVEGMLYIHQTWSKLVVELRTESSKSSSRMAALNVTPGASKGLMYEYMNDPRVVAKETMHAHRGLAFLELSIDQEMLEGEYYTGRDRLNIGSMQFRRVSMGRLDYEEARNTYERKTGDAA